MKTILYPLVIFCFISLISFAQYQKPQHKGGDTVGVKHDSNVIAPSKTVVPSKTIDKGTINPISGDENENKLTKEQELKAKEELEKKIKSRENISKDSVSVKKKDTEKEATNVLSAPTILSSWYSGGLTQVSPSDNTMAISNNGNIVVADNEHIYFYTIAGVLRGSLTYNSFFGNSEQYCDVHLLYDSGTDRFIFVLQSGVSSPVEKVRVCFSLSNDPYVDGFHTYAFDIVGLTGKTFDYPNIAISNDELFITGNLNGSSATNILFQINKSAGYAGSSITYTYWTDIQDGCQCGWYARALYPVSWGQQGSYGPGIYLLATESATINDKVYLYEVTNNQANSGQLLLLSSVSVSTFNLPTAALQLGSSCTIDDANHAWANVTGGFYLNGLIHFCYITNDGSGYSEILYNRLDVSSYSISTQIAGLANADYRKGTVASLGTNISDKAVVVGFLRSDATVYPEIRYKYYDDSMTPTSSVVVKTGDSYVDHLCSVGYPDERWGDYCGIQRKYNTTTYPSVWMVGSYGGSSHYWNDWVAQIGYPAVGISENEFSSSISIYPNPTTGIITLKQQNKTLPLTVSISNIIGENIFEKNILNASTEIDLSKQPSGIYFVKINTDKGSTMKKLVLNK